MNNLSEQSPEFLAAGCSQKQADNRHEPFCFELFRRAIGYRDEHCWSILYTEYYRLVGQWAAQFVRRSAPLLETPPEELIADAFTSFWRAYTAEKLQNAEGLPAVLSYLKSCVTTAVLQAKRKQDRRIKSVDWEQEIHGDGLSTDQDANRPETQMIAQMTRDTLWQLVKETCTDEKEEILARLSFVADLTPSAILERHPELFIDVKEIYTLRRNLKNRLARNKGLQALWGNQ